MPVPKPTMPLRVGRKQSNDLVRKAAEPSVIAPAAPKAPERYGFSSEQLVSHKSAQLPIVTDAILVDGHCLQVLGACSLLTRCSLADS